MHIHLMIFWICLLAGTTAFGQDGFKQSDRERLIHLEANFEELDKRFEEIDKRIEEMRNDMNNRFAQVDNRFEELRSDMNKRAEEMRVDMNNRFTLVDKRFEQVDNRFADMIGLLSSIVTAFSGIVIAAIGFALWDRKSTLKMVKDEIKSIEITIQQTLQYHALLERVVKILQKMSVQDEKLAKIMQSFSLL